MDNSTNAAAAPVDDGVLFYANLGFGVTLTFLLIQLLITVVGIVIIILNGIVMSAMLPFLKQITSDQIMMTSLAIVDLTTGMALIYYAIYNLVNFQNTAECLFRNSITDSVSINTGLTVMLMAVNRHVQIHQPYRYSEIFSQRNTLIIIISIWVFAIILGLLPVFGWRNYFDPIYTGGYECIFFVLYKNGYLMFKGIVFLVPIIIMTVAYIHIFKTAHGHAKAISAEANRFDEGAQKKSVFEKQAWKYTKTIAFVVGLYLLMYLPIVIFFFVVGSDSLDDTGPIELGTYFLYCAVPAYLNSLINPIIYSFKISYVRAKFRCCSSRESM